MKLDSLLPIIAIVLILALGHVLAPGTPTARPGRVCTVADPFSRSVSLTADGSSPTVFSSPAPDPYTSIAVPVQTGGLYKYSTGVVTPSYRGAHRFWGPDILGDCCAQLQGFASTCMAPFTDTMNAIKTPLKRLGRSLSVLPGTKDDR